jgi:hypothetical protein
VETKAHLCFLKKVGGRCGCVFGAKVAVDQKSLGTAELDHVVAKAGEYGPLVA